MKRILLIAASLFVMTNVAEAKLLKFGVKGGLNYSNITTTKDIEGITWSGSTGFHAGVVLGVKIPVIGLTIQPELQFSSINAEVNKNNLPEEFKMSYMELPVNIQWGIDLKVLRPYLQVGPYFGYAVSKMDNMDWEDINRFDVGIGAGLGVDIWKFQVAAKYNWSLGTVESVEREYGKAKANGLQISAAFFF